MNSGFTARETAGLVETLHGALRRFQDEGAGLEKQFRARKEGIEKDSREKLKRLEEEEKASRQELQEKYQQAWRRAQSISEKRAGWIVEAHASSKRKALQRIEQEEGRRKYLVQKETLETERNSANRVAQAEAEIKSFQEHAAEREGSIAQSREVVRRTFSGYPMFRKYLAAPAGNLPTDQDERQILATLVELEARIGNELSRYKSTVFPQLFRFAPLWLWLLFFGSLLVVTFTNIELGGLEQTKVRQIAIGGLAAGGLLYLLGLQLARGRARTVASSVIQAEGMLNLARQKAEHRHATILEETRQTTAEKLDVLNKEWKNAIAQAEEGRETFETNLDAKYRRALYKLQELSRLWENRVKEEEKAAFQGLDREIISSREKLQGGYHVALPESEASYKSENERIRAEWETAIKPLVAQVESTRATASEFFPEWKKFAYKPPETFLQQVPYGRVEMELPAGLPGLDSEKLSSPLTLKFPEEGSLLLESAEGGRELAISTLNNLVLRLLSTIPPGKVNFTLIDPVALGQSFSGIMHLADFEENIVNRRIWTEPGEIEERLLELNAHMEKVIQMYLRNEFTDIVQYNQKAGRVAEKLHFLVVADFPANFSDGATKRLLKIAASGARCGVFFLVHWDKRRPLPAGLLAQDLAASAAHLHLSGTKVTLSQVNDSGAEVVLDRAPEPQLTIDFLRAVGEASRGSNVVQIPFSQVMPPEDKIWSLDTTEELRIPIGRSGATKLQYLALGKGTRQHVLMAGKTGSGKSTLLHVIVTNLSLWCSPEQVEFYLIDFKKGVEFKDYATANLPHARVVAIESDREFGLSVLRRVDEELRQRGELFRKFGAQDLPGFKRASGQPMPRVLLVIDEFQELFVEEDSVSQNASMLLDRIVRQGRAFGIHVILGSQTLGGAYTLPRTTLAQMVVRIALQCSESDAYLIMDESNPAPRLLSRPGEGIYNDSGGITEANSPFQTVWLPEKERRELLQRVRSMQKGAFEGPIVFEGNALADIRENAQLRALLEGKGVGQIDPPRVWLGVPNEIKGPTEAVFRRQVGNNLLLVGRSEESIIALLAASIASLAAQASREALRFVLLESAPSASAEQTLVSHLAGAIPHQAEITKGAEVPGMLEQLAAEVDARAAGGTGPAIFVMIRNISAFKSLKPEDEFSLSYQENANNPAAHLQKLLGEGPTHGIHFLVSADSFTSANRFLGRKGLKEFQTRVLFQMSANDSASLCDDPRASRLGLYRALLYEEQEGRFEVFRPYALPSPEWINEVASSLGKISSTTEPNERRTGGAAA